MKTDIATGIIADDLLQDGEVCPYPRLSTELSQWERLTLSDGNTLLRALRVLSRKFTWDQVPLGEALRSVSDMEGAIAYFRAVGNSKRPRSFFIRPQSPAGVCLSEPVPIPGGEVLDLHFESGYVPRFKPFREEFLRYSENKKVHARWWRHKDSQSLGTVIAVHGWLFGDQRVSAITLMPGFFYRLGLDVVLYELPYHGRRRPTGAGDTTVFPSAHVARTNEGFAQAIFELRSIENWLRNECEAKAVGAVGMSLGGYVAALWGGLDPLDFVIPVVPLTSLPRLVKALVPTLTIAEDIQIPEDEFESLYALHSPLHYAPRVPKPGRLILAARHDPIVPAEHAIALWEHWNQPSIVWLEGGHLDQLVASHALDHIHRFLRSLGLARDNLVETSGLSG